MKKIIYFSFFLGALLAAAGCSTTGKPQADEVIVSERAQAWVDRLLKHNFEEAWAYTTPSFRSSGNAKGYKKWVAGAYTWTDAQVSSVSCEESRCDVIFLVDYSLPRLKLQNTREIKYTWIKVDGQWWVFHR